MMAKARLLLDKHGLTDWRLSIENLPNANMHPKAKIDGHQRLCCSKEKVIRIHTGIGRQFRQTLLHEIAHVLRGESEVEHDEKWLDIAEKTGCSLVHLWPYDLRLAEKRTLGYLREAKANLNPQKQSDVDHLLIKILSVRVPEQVWRDAVDMGVRLARREKP